MLLLSTPTIAIYSSPWQLIRILPSCTGQRLNRPKHCCKGEQLAPNAVYHSDFRDTHNCHTHSGFWSWSVIHIAVSMLQLDRCDRRNSFMNSKNSPTQTIKRISSPPYITNINATGRQRIQKFSHLTENKRTSNSNSSSSSSSSGGRSSIYIAT